MGVANVYEMIISAPRVSNLSQQTCSVEWQPCKAIQGSSLEYVLQLQGEQEYQKVSETKMSTFTYEQSLRMYNYLYDCCIHQVFLFWFERQEDCFLLMPLYFEVLFLPRHQDLYTYENPLVMGVSKFCCR